MKKTRYSLIPTVTVLLAFSPLATIGNDIPAELPPGARTLSGQYSGPGEITSSIPNAGDSDLNSNGVENEEYQISQSQSRAYPLADEPIIDSALLNEVRVTPITQYVRVIIYLDYQPHDVIRQQIEGRHAGEMRQIREQMRAIQSRYV